jgi:hypothetical protein
VSLIISTSTLPLGSRLGGIARVNDSKSEASDLTKNDWGTDVVFHGMVPTLLQRSCIRTSCIKTASVASSTFSSSIRRHSSMYGVHGR